LQVYAKVVEAAALDYLRRDWSVIRLRGKLPAERWAEYQQRHMTTEEVEERPWPGVGVVTGAISGIVVLDADSPEAVGELTRRGHPATPMAKTARGVHAYFEHPRGQLPTRIGLGNGLDLKGDGGYVVAPPSKHPSGAVYQWLISPEDEKPAPLPAWVMDQIRVRGRRATTEDLGEEIPNGSRNKTMTSIAGTLRRRGLGETAIYAALLGINADA
jgi:Bifunctional DNA primase/polymerase, N-terminal